MNHEDLLEQIKSSIDELFSDADVPQTTTEESLNDIIGHAQIMIDSLA